MSESVTGVIQEIKDMIKQKSSSQKDEIKVMKIMLNDKNYKVGIYDRTGHVGDFSPYEESRKMIANILRNTTKISSGEAKSLADQYEIATSDARTFVNISKEFINTYVYTGRKLPLGGRETMNASLVLKHIKGGYKAVPENMNTGVAARSSAFVPPHDSIRTSCPCPAWLKNIKESE